MLTLAAANTFSTKRITGDSSVVVSLTSHGSRISSAYFTIESIGAGRTRPGRVILWLDDEQVFRSPPKSLRRLQLRGLEIKKSKNYGPHTKYFPYVQSVQSHTIPLVTADDDVLYDKYWLDQLLSTHKAFEGHIISQRAHFVALAKNGVIAPYREWSACNGGVVSPRNFATGVSGVLYPASFLNTLLQSGDDFQRFSPKADDVWLHAMAVRNGFTVKQVHEFPNHYPTIRGTQSANLWRTNVFEGGNDSQIQATYTDLDIGQLR